MNIKVPPDWRPAVGDEVVFRDLANCSCYVAPCNIYRVIDIDMFDRDYVIEPVRARAIRVPASRVVLSLLAPVYGRCKACNGPLLHGPHTEDDTELCTTCYLKDMCEV